MNSDHEKDILQLMFSSDEEGDDDGNSNRCAHLKTQNKTSVFLDLRADTKKQEQQDASFAASLQLEEEQQRDRRRNAEHDLMKGSAAGVSVLLVEKVIQLLRPHRASGVKPVGRDDAVFLAEKILELQDTFKQRGCPPHVDIGYHYTAQANIGAIRKGGLLTVEDRIANKNKNVENRAYFGNGIYVANNPNAFKRYGEVGLLVAMLRGNVQDLGTERFDSSSTIVYPTTNTITGNKAGTNPYKNEIILRTSSQVLPLVKFSKDKMDDPTFADMLWSIHKQIQYEILDVFFNESQKTCVTRIQKNSSSTGEVSFAQSGSAPSYSFGSLIPTPPSSQAANVSVSLVPVQNVRNENVTNFVSSAPVGTEQFAPTCVKDRDAAIVIMQSISAMHGYESKSFEELRYEYFLKGRSVPNFGTASNGGFKEPVTASGLRFGNPTSCFSSFPKTPAAPTFQSSQYWQTFGALQPNPKSGCSYSSFGCSCMACSTAANVQQTGGFGSFSSVPGASATGSQSKYINGFGIGHSTTSNSFGGPPTFTFGSPAPAPTPPADPLFFAAPAPAANSFSNTQGFNFNAGAPAATNMFGGSPQSAAFPLPPAITPFSPFSVNFSNAPIPPALSSFSFGTPAPTFLQAAVVREQQKSTGISVPGGGFSS